MADWADYRTRDLTPVNEPSTDEYWNKSLSEITGREFNVKSGGSDKFLDFIAKELIPFIESNYRVSTGERCLGGYSYGGLFSLYTLFTRLSSLLNTLPEALPSHLEMDYCSIWKINLLQPIRILMQSCA